MWEGLERGRQGMNMGQKFPRHHFSTLFLNKKPNNTGIPNYQQNPGIPRLGWGLSIGTLTCSTDTVYKYFNQHK